MGTWGELRAQVRDALLKDTDPTAYRWSDSELLTIFKWALDTFARHTAAATATAFTPANALEYPLPDNVYDAEPFDLIGQVFVVDATGIVEYLNPVQHTNGLHPYTARGFYTYPERVLHLTEAFAATSTLQIRYYAYYNVPVADSDLIETPRWAQSALSYLMAAHALSGASLKTASIRQWGAKPDTGVPEQNPLKAQQQWFLEMYESELQRYPPQERVQHFRNLNED